MFLGAARVIGALCLLAASGCAAHVPPPVAPSLDEALTRPSAIEQLRGDLRAIVSDPLTRHALWAVVVNSLQTGEVLYSLNAFTHLVPASNQKLLIAAAAAERLGWRYRFETRLVAMGPIEDGRLRGDLVVVGDGDPTLNPRHPERLLAFDDWARQLRRAGVRLIEGNLVGDDSAFAQPGWGVGWEWEDLRLGYGAPVGALQFNEGQVVITAGPGMTPGAPAIVTIAPADSGLLVGNHAVTGAPQTRGVLDVARLPGSRFLDVHGSVPFGGTPLRVTAAVENPTLAYLGALEAALARADIFFTGRIVDADELRDRPDPATGRTLVVDVSPPLRDIVDVMMKGSRNAHAEALLRAMDRSGRPATAEGGFASVRETLARWGIDPDRYVARDGSGLSRYNFVTADMLAALLTYTWLDPEIHDLFFESLPEAGRSGTLARRLQGTPAEGRVRAKTGSMSYARALSGYIRTVEGEPLVFSIITNNHHVPGAVIDERVDQILLRLVAFRRDGMR
jgi:serine-type D-Ala-D-Ala carboxypeptidase/endopeptidase (penicillin-binding protein 4)